MIISKVIQEFITIAEEGSFSAAAKKLYVSQPTLTLQIKKLEDEIGFRLFHRNPRGVTLTLAGEVFYQEMLLVADSVHLAVKHGLKASDAQNKTLTLGAFAAAEYTMVEDIIELYHAKYPEITIQMKLFPIPTLDRIDKLVRGEVDCIIGVFRNNVSIHKVRMKVIKQDYDCVAVPEGDPLYHHDILSPHDLEGRTLLVTRDEPSSPSYVAQEEILAINCAVNIETIEFSESKALQLKYGDKLLLCPKSFGDLIEGARAIVLSLNCGSVFIGVLYRDDCSEATHLFIDSF